MLREEVEMCPHCDTEITIEWDVENDGYEVICPECGEKIMLCDACLHSEDNGFQYCDWCKEGCFRKTGKCPPKHKYRVVDYYDIWTDEDGGYVVNDVAKTDYVIYLSDLSDESILKGLQDVGYLKSTATLNDIHIEGDEYFLEIYELETGYPICRLDFEEDSKECYR